MVKAVTALEAREYVEGYISSQEGVTGEPQVMAFPPLWMDGQVISRVSSTYQQHGMTMCLCWDVWAEEEDGQRTIFGTY